MQSSNNYDRIWLLSHIIDMHRRAILLVLNAKPEIFQDEIKIFFNLTKAEEFLRDRASIHALQQKLLKNSAEKPESLDLFNDQNYLHLFNIHETFRKHNEERIDRVLNTLHEEKYISEDLRSFAFIYDMADARKNLLRDPETVKKLLADIEKMTEAQVNNCHPDNQLTLQYLYVALCKIQELSQGHVPSFQNMVEGKEGAGRFR